MRYRRSLALALALVLLAPAASADDREKSRVAFRRGVTAAKENDYASARDAFAEAYRLFAHPSILLNLGIARAKTGELVQAEQDLVKFIADDGGASADEVKSAQKTLADVRELLGTISLSVKPAGAKATLDGKPVVLMAGQATPIRAAAGQHALRVEADGYVMDEQQVDVLAKVETEVSVELDPVVTPGDDQSASSSSSKILGIGLMGLGVLMAGAGTYFGIRALSLERDFGVATKEERAEIRSDGVMSRTIADVAFLSAIVSAGIGAYLVFAPSTSSTPPARQTGVVLAPTYAGLRGTF